MKQSFLPLNHNPLRAAFIVVLLSLTLTSCLRKQGGFNDPVLARVHEDYLYYSEVKDLVAGANPKDSLELVRNYINNWIHQRLILHKAERNLTEKDKDFKKQLTEYRNSLLIYQYESKLVSQYLDTLVSDTQIVRYYNENINSFELKNNILKAYFVRIEKDHPRLRSIKRFLFSNTPGARDSVEYYCIRYKLNYLLDDENWMVFDDFIRLVPVKTYNQEAFLQNNRELEIEEGPYVYLIRVIDFIIREGISPLSFERENIRQILLNKRKLGIIEKMHEDVFKTALQNNEFETY
jgi:hypothetical protein